MDKKTAKQIYDYLDFIIENPETELEYSNTFELLVAVMLSAQCTDKQVNKVTRELFKKYNKPEHFAVLKQSELEKLIYSTGFYRNKAKNIILASQQILSLHNGQVPGNFDDLVNLAGVGRKTANVILIVGFNIPAIPVDTHVFRVSNRLGLTNAKTPEQCEKQLAQVFDEQYYAKLHHLLILFGRYYCTARNKNCNLNYLIDLYNKKLEEKNKNK